MTFLIFKTGLITLVAQAVSTLRAKLWKVVMISKITMFLSFAPFFWKFAFLRLWYFISPCTDLINSNFAVVVWIYKIQVFDKAFLSCSNRCYDNRNCLFPISMVTIVRETNSFVKIMQLINPSYLLKNGVKQIKNPQG